MHVTTSQSARRGCIEGKDEYKCFLDCCCLLELLLKCNPCSNKGRWKTASKTPPTLQAQPDGVQDTLGWGCPIRSSESRMSLS